MLGKVEAWYRCAAEFVSDYPFLCGMAAGVAAVWILVIILWLLRPKSLKEISISSENGTVKVSSGAVAGVIRGLETELGMFRIGRVAVYDRGRKKRLRITADFLYEKEAKLADSVGVLQTRSKEILPDVLGIQNVEKVEVVIRRTIKPKE